MENERQYQPEDLFRGLYRFRNDFPDRTREFVRGVQHFYQKYNSISDKQYSCLYTLLKLCIEDERKWMKMFNEIKHKYNL